MEQKNESGASVSAIAFDELRVVQTIKSGDARMNLARLGCRVLLWIESAPYVLGLPIHA